MFVYYVPALYPQGPEEAIGSLKAELQMVVSHYEGAGSQTRGPLEEQPVLTTAQPSLRSQITSTFKMSTFPLPGGKSYRTM